MWLAAVASVLTASVFYALHLTVDWTYVGIVFLGVITVYNIHSLVSYSKGVVHPQLKIFIKYRKYNLIFITALAAILGSMLLYHYIHVNVFWYISIPALSIMIYERYTLQTNYSKVWQWTKPFLLSASWLYYTVGIPQVITQSYHIGFTIISFVFIFSIVMLFELRDSNILDSTRDKGWADFLGRRLWVNVYYIVIGIMIVSSFWNAQSIYQYLWIVVVGMCLFLILRTRHVFTYLQSMLSWDGCLLLLAAYFILHHA